jgi:hypothetical protein
LQDVFKKRDAPARQNDEQQRFTFEFQVALPRHRHENVRAGQQYDGQPAGLSQVVHKYYSSGDSVSPNASRVPRRTWRT